MVELDCLASLDGLLWLRTGAHVAEKFNCNQSTVSRNSRKCLDIFELEIFKKNSEWQLNGDLRLLNLERKVHQQVRWLGGRPLRLESQHWSAPLLSDHHPKGWIRGNFNYQEYHRPFELLQDRVIDAWIASYPDTPASNDPTMITIPLSRMPMLLVVKHGHPLLELGSQISFADIAAYPRLPLPEGAFPRFEAALNHCGLGSQTDPSPQRQRSAKHNTTQIEDLLVGFATPLSLPLYGANWQALPLRLPIDVGDALVVPRVYRHATPTTQLLSLLLSRLKKLATGNTALSDLIVLDFLNTATLCHQR